MICNHCGAQWHFSRFPGTMGLVCPFCGQAITEAALPQSGAFQQTVFRIRRDYGLKILQDRNRALSYLMDLAPGDVRQQNMMRMLLVCQGNDALIRALSLPKEQQLLQLERVILRLTDQVFLSREAAEDICFSFWRAIVPTEPEAGSTASADPSADTTYHIKPRHSRTSVRRAPDASPLVAAAQAGDITSQKILAARYDLGQDMPRDPVRSFYWYNRAAALGDGEALYLLGKMLLSGYGTAENPEQALICMKKAAEKGISAAMKVLGDCCEAGIGTEKDARQAIHWQHCGAMAGLDECQYTLGRYFQKGIGTEPDPDLAYYWYKKAADAGHAQAMYQMGLIYEQGRAVEPDPDLAFYWFRRAADCGDRRAAEKLKK